MEDSKFNEFQAKIEKKEQGILATVNIPTFSFEKFTYILRIMLPKKALHQMALPFNICFKYSPRNNFFQHFNWFSPVRKHCTKKKASIKDFVCKLQETADLVTFTEEILNGKLHFLFSVKYLKMVIS